MLGLEACGVWCDRCVSQAFFLHRECVKQVGGKLYILFLKQVGVSLHFYIERMWCGGDGGVCVSPAPFVHTESV